MIVSVFTVAAVVEAPAAFIVVLLATVSVFTAVVAAVTVKFVVLPEDVTESEALLVVLWTALTA